jgi:hypothetical protein
MKQFVDQHIQSGTFFMTLTNSILSLKYNSKTKLILVKYKQKTVLFS